MTDNLNQNVHGRNDNNEGHINKKKKLNKEPAGSSGDSQPTSNDKTITLKIFRINPNNENSNTHFDEFKVNTKRWTTVLDALLDVKGYQDHSLALRYSCRMASCGSCGMKINGIPRLACYTKISDLVSNETEDPVITCEPLANFPYVKDLVTDFSQFFNHHKKVMPYIKNNDSDMLDPEKLSEYVQSPEDLDKFLQFSYCIKCGLCYSSCPTVATDVNFPGPQALSQAYRYFIDSRDSANKKRFNILDDRHGIWRCHFAGSCSYVCPKGVDPALGIQLLRSHMLGFNRNEKKITKLREK